MIDRVIANGQLGTPTKASGAIENAHADLVALGKAALSNRNRPRRALAGHAVEVPFHPSGLADTATIQDWELDADRLLALEERPHPAR